MKKIVTALAIVALTAVGTSAKALMIAPSPISLRVAAADAVVIGKVTEVADKAEAADLFKGDTRQMKVTTVKVDETVLGKKGKTIKVAYMQAPAAGPGGPGRPIIRPGMRGGVQLAKDQEAMFFLSQHPTKKDVFVVQAYFDVVNKAGNANFAAERDQARKYARLLADPKKGFESKDAQDRLETAAMLITRYRTAPPGVTRTEAAPADLSKKILQTLADAEWNAPNPRNFMLNPQGLFYRLNLTADDGWIPPTDFNQAQVEARKWLKAHAGKYRIQRFVRAEDKAGAEPEPE